jgi:putative tryptophan/tyrosine transport system substrate-binding protein
MTLLTRSLLLLSLLCCLPVEAAEIRVLIMREDTAVARQASELLSREFARLGWASGEVTVTPERPLTLPHREGDQALVLLGSRALMVAPKHTGGKPVVGALISRSALDELVPTIADRWSVIVLDQPAERWVNLILSAFPSRQQVGMLVGPAGQKTARTLERKLQEKRHALASETISSPEEVVPALERLLSRTDILLALPDPMVHNRNTVQPLLLTTYRAGIPVIGYSESYLQAGSTLALYSTVPQLTAQVVESLQQLFEGRSVPAIQSPRYYTVGVNSAVARSLGLSLPSASELQDRLRSADQ